MVDAFSKPSVLLLKTTQLLLSAFQRLFYCGQGNQTVTLSTELHLVQRTRMRGPLQLSSMLSWLTLANFTFILPIYKGRDGVVGLVTCYGLGGKWIESRWGRNFPHQSTQVLGPRALQYNGHRVSSPGMKKE
jgi:hypothetical protein